MINKEEHKRGAVRSPRKNVPVRSLLEGLKENREETQGQPMFGNEEIKI